MSRSSDQHRRLAEIRDIVRDLLERGDIPPSAERDRLADLVATRRGRPTK